MVDHELLRGRDRDVGAEHGLAEDRWSVAGWVTLVVGVVVVELVLLAVWQRNGYWDYSDGVYSLSAREFLHGLVPYRDFAAAQPPPVYLAGVALLWVNDGLASLRAGLALVDLMTAVLVAVVVWRLSGLRWLAVAAAVASPLLPITLHEHAQLTWPAPRHSVRSL